MRAATPATVLVRCASTRLPRHTGDRPSFVRAKLIKTEHSNQSGNDGLVVLADGTKYVTSVRYGSVSR